MAAMFGNFREKRRQMKSLLKLLESHPLSEWRPFPASGSVFTRDHYHAFCEGDGFCMAISQHFSDTVKISVKADGEGAADFHIECPLFPFGAASDVFSVASRIASVMKEEEKRRDLKRESAILEKALKGGNA